MNRVVRILRCGRSRRAKGQCAGVTAPPAAKWLLLGCWAVFFSNLAAGSSPGFADASLSGLPETRLAALAADVPLSLDLVITEIAAANQTGLADEDGAQEDWIEIHNRSDEAMDLAGWALSDDPAVPGQWVFPSRLLGAGQYLVVFASGKDRKAPTGTNRFHTNFKLASGGEFLGLYSPGSPRVLVSGFSPGFPEQRNDISYGRDPGGDLRYFATPTPGAANGASSITGLVGPVHFSVGRGHFRRAFTLHLTTPTPGARIYYTTNGSEPTLERGLPYPGPLQITNTALLRAAAFRTNLLPSRVGTHSYLFHFSEAYRSLPIVSIVTGEDNLTGPQGILGISNVVQLADGSYVPRDATGYHNPSQRGLTWERPTSVEWIEPEDNSGFQVDCGIRVQGSDYNRTRTTPASKFSFRLYFRGDYGPGRLDYPLFPLTSVRSYDQLVLRAGFNDPVNPFIRDELTRRLSHDMGQVASHGTFAIVLVNGVAYASAPYYNPCERVHEEFLQAHLGGSESWDVISPPWATGPGLPGVVDGDRTNFQALVDFINTEPVTDPAVYRQAGEWLDLTNFVDYLLLNVYSAMGDWPQNNFRAGRDRTPGQPSSRWRFVVWDGEWAMGIYGRSVAINMFTNDGPGPNAGGLASVADSEIAQLYQRLYANPEFRLLWADRIHRHLFHGGALTDSNITARFTQMKTDLLGVLPGMATDILTTWVPQRRDILFGHFDQFGLMASSNAPAFSQHGGRVPRGFGLSMTAAQMGGTIFFTTNGSDPRVPFTGGVAGDAMAYSDPILLDQSTIVRARTFQDGTWSALTEAAFEVGILGVPLRITEIHYHPPEGGALEFIELQNIGPAPLDLGGMSFDGIQFQFPEGTWLDPGAILVLASDDDPAAFATRYPEVTVAGYFGGALNNGGERISIVDRFGSLVTSVDYNDAGGWPAAADGGGASLETIDPLGDPDDPANWRAGGSPGSASVPSLPPDVRLHEVMADNASAVVHQGAYPDWIELHNAGPGPADLSGWSLTDDGDARKFVFPAGTTIDSGGYLVVWCDAATNNPAGMQSGFALSRNGESVFLYDAATNRIDAVSFGLQLSDYAVGRVGSEWVLTVPTLLGPNVAASLGAPSQLSLNEWMANPPPGEPDWMELYNRSAAQPAALRGLYVANGVTVHPITSLSFVAPGAFVVLFADEGVGPDHVDFKLPASGSDIVLYDAAALEVDHVRYGAQIEGVSRGRLPDGSSNLVEFAGTASPGASNYLLDYPGPVLNEVLARNRRALTNAGGLPDFVEIYNPNLGPWDLSGMSLSVGGPQVGQWMFPWGKSLAGRGHLVIWCDGFRPASTNAGDCNTGRWLDGQSGGAYLFNAAGQLVDSVEYGFQVADRSIGLVGDQWRLLEVPTPGAPNTAPTALGSNTAVRINEWMALPDHGPDWFELFHPGNLPLDLAGLILSDDPSAAGANQFRVPPLSFIGPAGFVKWVADGNVEEGRNHVPFRLDAQGDTLLIYTADGTALIDGVSFGAQRLGVSEGRLPDGAAETLSFAGSSSPGEANYLALPGLVINELLTHAIPPLEQAVELHNLSGNPQPLGGWYLSDSQEDWRKYRIPDGTILAPGGFMVIYENQFNDGSPAGFTLSAAHGGEVWLSEADPAGVLTGYRTGAKFGAASQGVSIGRHLTPTGVHYVALSGRTFGMDDPVSQEEFRTGLGASNAPPLVGPVVLHEIMYHPLETNGSTGDEEFMELLNIDQGPTPLYDPLNPNNTWRLSGGVEFAFPASQVMLAPGGYLLVVGFDPVTEPGTLDAFRNRYAVPAEVPVYGPYRGSLDNAGERVELLKPDPPSAPGAPDPGFVPFVRVDLVEYSDAPPWPTGGVDGGGLSLQRRHAASYGNDPENWQAALPTAGRTNAAAIVPLPVIAQSPQNQTVPAAAPAWFSVAASGTGPIHYQWRFNGFALPGETNASLALDYVLLENQGDYDVFVSNPGGSTFSAVAHLQVNTPPLLVQLPRNVETPPGSNVVFTVGASGSPPLYYQWWFNGSEVPGATGSSLLLTNVGFGQAGTYSVTVSNPFGTADASASLSVLGKPVFSLHPMSQTAVEHSTVAMSVAVIGTPPVSFRWLRNRVNVTSALRVDAPTNSTIVLTNLQLADAGDYTVVAQNSLGGALSGAGTLSVAPDSDGDGLPDAWETSQPGFNPNDPTDGDQDADDDGMSNAAEYLAGTDYLDPASYLRVDLTATGAAILFFQAVSNRTYTVQFTDGLTPLEWQKLGDVLPSGETRIQAYLDPHPTTNRFYRLATPMQP